MGQRTLFIVLTAFWVTMNVLLWRSEFSDKFHLGSPVPVEVVWKRILTAPDNSNLDIFYRGEKIGLCRWSANIGEEAATGKVSSDTYSPEGMIKKLTGYTLDMDGNVFIGDRTNRFRYYVGMRFSRTNTWEDFDLRVGQRPLLWEVRSSNPNQNVSLVFSDGASQWERSYKFSELEHPEKLVEELGGPLVASVLLKSMGTSLDDMKSLSGSLKWEANNDWVKINRTDVRAYRLQAHLLDRYKVVVMVSRVGEILRVELPNGITLVNEEIK